MLRQSSSTCSFLPFPQSSHSESLSPPHHNPLRSRGIASLLGVEMIKKMISTDEGVGTDPSLCIRRKEKQHLHSEERLPVWTRHWKFVCFIPSYSQSHCTQAKRGRWQRNLQRNLDAFQPRFPWKILNITLRENATNKEVYRRSGVKPLSGTIANFGLLLMYSQCCRSEMRIRFSIRN